MRFLKIIVIPCVLIFLYSCSKDKSYQPPENGTGADSTFQPVSAGATWHYQDSLQGDFTLTATGKDTMINGIKYYVFASQQDTSDEIIPTYFGQDGTDYYGQGLISGLEGVNVLYLKDTAVQTNWSQQIDLTVPGYGNISATIESLLTAVNATKTVNGKTYTHVSEVSFQIKIPVPVVGNITYATGSWFFARGVGLISLEIANNNAVVGSLSLTSYTHN